MEFRSTTINEKFFSLYILWDNYPMPFMISGIKTYWYLHNALSSLLCYFISKILALLIETRRIDNAKDLMLLDEELVSHPSLKELIFQTMLDIAPMSQQGFPTFKKKIGVDKSVMDFNIVNDNSSYNDKRF